MMDRELLELRSNDIAMECFHDIAMDLPPIERSKYVDIITEAIVNNPDTQYKIISKLAKQVEDLQQIDLEQCRKSMGNITKYPYYDVLAKAMDIINESEVTADIPNVIRMNKIHTILLEHADDFIWGFKHNDMIITRTYILLTRLLFIMIDLSISDYIKKLEVNFKFNMKFNPVPSRVNRVCKDADSIIKLFEKGDWRAVMTACKKSATTQSMKALDEMNGTEPPSAMASEGFWEDAGKLLDTKVGEISDTVKAANKKSTTMTTLVNKIKVFAGNHKVATAVVATVIVIMISYRYIAFYVAKAGGAFSNFVRHCAELIKANDACNRNQSDSAVEKHNKLYAKMIGTADRIDAFFNKTSAAAEKEVKEANKKDFNTAEITAINGIDFDL